MRLVLQQPLPGGSAQAAMAPEHRRRGVEAGYRPEGARSAAVMIMLTPAGNGERPRELPEWTVLLIRRNTYDGHHSGQISFPGGRTEETDKDHWHTACRETFEEVGVESAYLEKVGPLTDLYVPPSNFLIHPFLAVNRSTKPLRTDPEEVAGYKFIPLKELSPAKAVMLDFPDDKGNSRPAPAWEYEDYVIWGATAMILSELNRLIDTGALALA